MNRQPVIPPTDPKYPAVKRRLFETWVKTIIGYSIIIAFVAVTAYLAHNYLHVPPWTSIVMSLVLPLVMWLASAKVSLLITKSKPADPNNPVHARLIAIVNRVLAKSTIKYKLPVYVSPDPRPNAFATGPFPRWGVVAATAGLFECGMDDDEIEGVFAHEVSHVTHMDVLINSLFMVLENLWFMMLDQIWQIGLRLGGLTRDLINTLLGRRTAATIVPPIVVTVLTNLFFWLVRQAMKPVQMFVVRSRESGADAGAAYITGNPCALATGLQKLVKYAESHRPEGREAAYYQATRSMMTIDPLYDTLTEQPKQGGVIAWLKRLWYNLNLSHPPVPERIYQLERMNGGACPRIS